MKHTWANPLLLFCNSTSKPKLASPLITVQSSITPIESSAVTSEFRSTISCFADRPMSLVDASMYVILHFTCNTNRICSYTIYILQSIANTYLVCSLLCGAVPGLLYMCNILYIGGRMPIYTLLLEQLQGVYTARLPRYITQPTRSDVIDSEKMHCDTWTDWLIFHLLLSFPFAYFQHLRRDLASAADQPLLQIHWTSPQYLQMQPSTTKHRNHSCFRNSILRNAISPERISLHDAW